jgi:hypothetical protein
MSLLRCFRKILGWRVGHWRLPRLFELAENKLATVTEMFTLGWGVNGEAWKRRRRLFSWEEEFIGECVELLTFVVLQVA